RWIVAERQVPRTEPLMPLSKGVPFVDLAWLSQVAGYFVMEGGGIPALQCLYAAAVVLSTALVAMAARCRTGRVWTAALAATVFVGVEWQANQIIRPQLA